MAASLIGVERASRACRALLGLVFVAAALLKWFDPAGQSTYYGNLAHAAPAVGWAIIVGELLLGAWLICGIRAGLATGVALFVLAMFSGAIVADMLAKHPVPCGCFGAAWAAAHSPAAIEHGLAIGPLSDIALIALAVAAWMLARRPCPRPSVSQPRGIIEGMARECRCRVKPNPR